MDLRYRCAFVFALLIALPLLLASPASAGKLYQMEMQYCVPYAGGATTVTVDYWAKDQNGAPEGSTTVGFDGATNTNVVCDDPKVCVTDISQVGPMLCVTMVLNGTKNARFDSRAYVEVTVDGQTGHLRLHTSCSKPLPIGSTLMLSDPAVEALTGPGSYVLMSGIGECVPNAPGCPEGGKIFEIDGEFRIPLGACSPSTVTLNVYRQTNNLQGSSSAMFTGSGLSGIVCDDVACLTDAYVEGSELVITFDSLGYKEDGSYDSEVFDGYSSWEMDLGSCGTHQTDRLKTNCSVPFLLDQPMDAGSGGFTFRGGCGACLVGQPVSVENNMSFGTLKASYED